MPFITLPYDTIMAQFYTAFFWTVGFVLTFFLILGLLYLLAQKYKEDTYGAPIPSRQK